MTKINTVLRYKAARTFLLCFVSLISVLFANWYITAGLVYNARWFLNRIHVGSTQLNKPFICSIKQGNWNGWRVLTAGLIAVYFDLLLQFTLWIALTLPSLLANWKWVITMDCWMWWHPPFQTRKVAFCFAYVKLINYSNLNGEEPIRKEFWKLLFHQCTKQNKIKSEVLWMMPRGLWAQHYILWEQLIFVGILVLANVAIIYLTSHHSKSIWLYF